MRARNHLCVGDSSVQSDPTIMIVSRVVADSLCQRDGLRVRAVISIVDEGERACHGFETIEHRLQLEMDDAPAQPGGAGRHSARPPTREHAQKIIEFAERLRGAGGVLVCHCNAGLSRSPAAALICAAVWLGPGLEHDAARRVHRLRPEARPHAGLVRFADELMQRNGALVAATTDEFQ
ncbi:MAG: hypothetical protein NTW19_20195 [Planctomycetota bacterium]|nr:hypothetical protein [Planctomycetota bacterium]